MEHTDGHGGEAEVWVDGALLTVYDGYSRPGERTPPGKLDGVAFRYTNDEAYCWEDAIRRNPHKRVVLEPVKRWAYYGYGRVESVMPVVIHFGLLRMEDPTWSTGEDLVGRFVAVPINRLEIVRADERPDLGDLPR
jgi:hypothetical protein